MKEDFFVRLKTFIDYTGLSYNRFGEEIGCSGGQISQMVTYQKNFGVDKLLKIFNRFPELNPDWLVKGSGNMMLPEKGNKNQKIKYSLPESSAKLKEENPNNERIKQLISENKLLKQINDSLMAQIKDKEEIILLLKKGKEKK
jgi:hypothetical protein